MKCNEKNRIHIEHHAFSSMLILHKNPNLSPDEMVGNESILWKCRNGNASECSMVPLLTPSYYIVLLSIVKIQNNEATK